MGKRRNDLAYSIWGKEVAVISRLSDNIQHQVKERLNVLLVINEEKLMPKEKFTGRKLSMQEER